MLYRDKGGLFWTLAMPAGVYVGLSVLPIPSLAGVSYKSYILPGMLAYSMLSGGIYGLAYWMTDMKSKGVIKRFLVTPIKTRDLVLALVFSRLSVMIFQVIFLSLIGQIFFKASIPPTAALSIPVIFLGGSIFLMIGLLISNYATSYQSAAPLTAIVGMPFTFLGNIFFPNSSLPHTLKLVSQILPITHLSDALRHAYLQPFNFSIFAKDILFLCLWFVAILLFTLKVFKLKE